ncbi:histidine phosphatase family protein [Nocardioides sp.]|uniref:histidine phosphatase family protein n=1 Tax=Nocardioides sp. TaxID=35761 RepID=UPI0027358477|nr:histidine phosphatase family protein [Nocardioides sp.]MDP3893365.1 histidine phosphatase family protein [Nocardioides sp.]
MTAPEALVEEGARRPSRDPRRLILLRHGQTAWNASHRIQGQRDVDLDESGHQQATSVAEELETHDVSLLWSSDLTRAAQTAAYVGKECGVEPVLDARLREFHLGERQGLTHEEYARRFPEEHREYVAGNYAVAEGAETTAEVAERMVACLRDLLASTPAGGTSVAVSHGAALRVALGHLLGWGSGAELSLAALGNCHRAVLEEQSYAGPLRLAAYNLRPGA